MMQNRKTTKRALGTSLLSLLLCVSLLIGTTFAWFTDSVTSGKNTIASGNLDVELEYLDAAGNWQPVQASTAIFDKNALWEPGYTTDVYLRVTNKGSLALKYSLGVNVVGEKGSINKDGDSFLLSDYIEFGVIEGVSTPYANRAEARAAVTSSKVISAGYTDAGSLYPAASGKTNVAYLAMVVYMPEETGNVANHATGKAAPSIDLGINLVATQEMEESDSFGSDYDEDATYPKQNVSVSVTLPVEVTADGKTAEDVELSDKNGSVSAQVPAGVQLANGVEALTFSVDKLEEGEANVTLNANEESRSLNVHVEGLKATNDVPIAVTIKGMLPIGLNMGNYTLYHVEGGVTNAMTLSATPTAHNEYSYDPATGDVTMMLQSFSEVTMVVNTTKAWEGNRDYSWYDANKDTFTLTNADQLAGFGAIVGGMDGQTKNSFAGKTVYLGANINIGDLTDEDNRNVVFYPIGYYNNKGTYHTANNKTGIEGVESSVSPFEGIFDGRGFTISNFYQNTWEMFGDYNDGYAAKSNHYKDAMGLFGYVYNGTVKNLRVENFSSDGEFTPTGVIAAYAAGVSKFENIAIANCNPRVYNTGNGGIVGIGGNTNEDGKLSFKNITIDNTNKITALWGSWDVACGGVIGMFRGNGDVDMDNCHVAAQIDVNNDVCGNYQYYRYRYAGMLIGTNKNMVTVNGVTTPVTENFDFTNCSVHFDSWNDYWYCELVANSLASYTHDHQFSRLTQVDSIDVDAMKVTIDGETTNIPTSGRYNYVLVTGDPSTDNAKCFHFVNGDIWTHDQAGTETVGNETVLKEDKQHVYLPFDQLLTGYGWGVDHIPVYKGNDELYFGDNVTVIDETKAESDEKFEAKDTAFVLSNNTDDTSVKGYITLGELFGSKVSEDIHEINSKTVMVSLEAVADTDNMAYVYTANTDDWTKGTIAFTKFDGTVSSADSVIAKQVRITIQDYYYCTPTTVEVTLNCISGGNVEGGFDW